MESLSDIVAMLRANARGERFDEFSFTSLADRIEAAWRREKAETEANALNVGAVVATTEKSSAVGNAAAMREALEKIDRIVWDKHRHTKEETEAHLLATEALSAPPRNCDVGTAKEQSRLMRNWCLKHGDCNESGGDCMLCQSKWAQLPYEADAEKEERNDAE